MDRRLSVERISELIEILHARDLHGDRNYIHPYTFPQVLFPSPSVAVSVTYISAHPCRTEGIWLITASNHIGSCLQTRDHNFKSEAKKRWN